MRLAERHPWIYEMLIITDKSVPFSVLWHHDRSRAEGFDRFVGFVGLALENASIGVICFLNFANYDRFQLAARMLQVQECLLG
jgi:hypothetical protein